MEDKTKNELRQVVLDKITENEVQPIPRIMFTALDVLMWLLWMLTTLFGALAVAVVMFVVQSRWYSFYEATHEDFFTFMIEVLPYLWIFVLVFVIFLSIKHIRHTKSGYRYPVGLVLVVSVTSSLFGGLVLHLMGVGFGADRWLGLVIPAYESQERMERNLWQQPQRGLLVGHVQNKDLDKPAMAILFEDIDGRNWDMGVSDLNEEELEFLAAGSNVRVVGQVLRISPPKFYACAVFPWTFDNPRTISELRETRENMISRMLRYQDTKITDIDNKTSLSAVCAQIAPVHRLHFQ
ncbi:MAG: hypothetical protein H6779_05460 [Candidatus Nomurabacteria bacterium]|nr:MAG: hypothetical protein H6779_05460 [Candidatus Nomurabacteria bacterium]